MYVSWHPGVFFWGGCIITYVYIHKHMGKGWSEGGGQVGKGRRDEAVLTKKPDLFGRV